MVHTEGYLYIPIRWKSCSPRTVGSRLKFLDSNLGFHWLEESLITVEMLLGLQFFLVELSIIFCFGSLYTMNCVFLCEIFWKKGFIELYYVEFFYKAIFDQIHIATVWAERRTAARKLTADLSYTFDGSSVNKKVTKLKKNVGFQWSINL